MKDMILLIKGKAVHHMEAKIYNDPKKFKNGLTQKEIVKKNGYREATEAEFAAHFKVDLKAEKPKEAKKPKKEDPIIAEVEIVQGESHD
jgi:hypothetical protein